MRRMTEAETRLDIDLARWPERVGDIETARTEALHAEAVAEDITRSGGGKAAAMAAMDLSDAVIMDGKLGPQSPAETLAALREAVDLYDNRERRRVANRQIRDAVRRRLIGNVAMDRIDGYLLQCERAVFHARDLTITYRHAGHDEAQIIVLSRDTSYATIAALILAVA